MKEIDYKDFKNFKAKPLKVVKSTEADIYYKNDILYKIYRDFTKEGLKRKNEKINILSHIKGLDEAVLPKDKIIIRNGRYKTLVGISEKYVEGQTLWNLATDTNNFSTYLKALVKASQGLKRIHNREENIILGDANFHNIIVSDDGKVHFIDFDSVMIDGINADRISKLYDEFNAYYGRKTTVNRNSDKLTFLLYFLDTLFDQDFEMLSMYEYDLVAERLNTLKNLRNTVVKLRKNGHAYVPYLHYVIDKKDSVEIENVHLRKMEMR